MSGVPTGCRSSASNCFCRYLGIRLSSTCCRISPANCLRIRFGGTLPRRKPGSRARSRTFSITRPVSCSTSSAGMEISTACLQPSTSAKWIYLGGEITFHDTKGGKYGWKRIIDSVPRFFVQNFGCRATQADGAALESLLEAKGLESADSRHAADLVILNTCTVTSSADEDVRQTVRRVHRENP